MKRSCQIKTPFFDMVMMIDPTTGISRGVQLIAHATTGCAAGAVGSGNCGAGAAGQLAGEISALLYSGGATQTEIAAQTQEWQERGIDIARLSGALASAIAGGGADDINLGSDLGGTAAANNALCGGLCIAAAVGALSAASGYLAVSETARLITEADAAYDAAGGGEAGAKAALLSVGDDALIAVGITVTGAGVIRVGGKIIEKATDAYKHFKSANGVSSAGLLTAKQLNDINHIFNKPTHKMDDFRALFDSDKEALLAIENAAQQAYKKGNLKFDNKGVLIETRININGLDVDLVGGKVIDGKFNVGSASRREVVK